MAGDRFSIGCVFFYGMTEGKHHIFGSTIGSCIVNIRENNPSFDALMNKSQITEINEASHRSESWLCTASVDLISALIEKNVDERPRCSLALFHPCLWTMEKIYNFFRNIITVLQNIPRGQIKETNLETEYDVIIRDWKKSIESDMRDEMLEEKNLSGEFNRDLLLFMGKHVRILDIIHK